jgi:hypothetical protein
MAANDIGGSSFKSHLFVLLRPYILELSLLSLPCTLNMSTHFTQSSPELEPDAPTPATSATNAFVQRPAQEKFNDHEQEFLAKYLDQYLAAEASNVKKGAKKHWVKKNVYHKYIEEFKSDGPTGPNLSSLFKVNFNSTMMHI